MISIHICEHCGAVKDAETPADIVQTLKKIGWELKRAEPKPRATNVETKPAKKKESREESGNQAGAVEAVTVTEEAVAVAEEGATA